ncbi:MAG: tetratricopeptide repeat protein [Cyanobacteria bacterium J06560_2]
MVDELSTQTVSDGSPSPVSVIELSQQAAQAKKAGNLAIAQAFYRQALSQEANLPELWFNYGNLLQQLGDRPQAEQAYTQALAVNPGFYPAHLNLANSLRDRNAPHKAITHYQQAIALNPSLFLAYRNLGQLLIAQKQYPPAVQVFAAWCRQDHADPTPLNGLGIALQSQGQHEKALQLFQQALSLDPQRFDSLNNLGTLLRMLKRPHEALPYLRQAVATDPSSDVALSNLVYALLNLGHIDEALSQTESVLTQHKNSASGHLMRGFALTQQARIKEALESFQRSWELENSATVAVSNALFTLLYRDDLTGEAFVAERQRWVQRLPQSTEQYTQWAGSKDTGRRLKVGYLSGDLRSHPVAFFLEPILANHSNTVDTYCYDTAGVEDATTAKLKADAHHWRTCVGITDQALAQQIHQDGIDILIDLSGHTAGNRVGVLQHKPAPIQMLYIGYPGSTGLDSVDYIISDRAVSPKEHSALYTEKTLPVDGSFWCYQPRAFMPEPNPLPALKNGHITFGSFNHTPKLSPSTIQLWSSVLAALPSAKLKLKALALGDSETCEHFKRQFVHYGTHPEQLIFEGPTLKIEDFFQSYHSIDIALDPTPYNGGTTTCESLWMGVPVITLQGERFCSRMSHSLLHSVGLPELSTLTGAQYVKTAVALSNDLAQLQHIRQGLRSTMAASPLCQAKLSAQGLEKAYRQAWITFCG